MASSDEEWGDILVDEPTTLRQAVRGTKRRRGELPPVSRFDPSLAYDHIVECMGGDKQKVDQFLKLFIDLKNCLTTTDGSDWLLDILIQAADKAYHRERQSRA